MRITVLANAEEPLRAHTQDKELYLFGGGGCCFSFSKERWGRRAPWHLVHCPLMALCMFLSWSPPMLEPWFLAGWYFVVMLVCSWCWQQITIATQAGAVECYPFKGERVAVEGFNVVSRSCACIGSLCLRHYVHGALTGLHLPRHHLCRAADRCGVSVPSGGAAEPAPGTRIDLRRDRDGVAAGCTCDEGCPSTVRFVHCVVS